MRRVVLSALALLGVAASLTVTASSTTHVAYAAGMRGLALAAIVVVLEVVNVVGTWSWITDPRTHVRVESAVAVLAASTVTGWCGALTYGPIGLVAPLGLLAAVHGVSRMWASPAHSTTGQSPTVASDTTARAVQSPAADEEAASTSLTGTPTPRRPAPARGAQEGDEDIVAALVTRPDLPGRDAVKAEFRCGTKRAERLLAQAAAHRRPHLAAVHAQEANP